jgi:hypothetical protein
MGTAQTFTLSSIAFQYALFVPQVYDQTLADNCASASCDLLQSTAGNQFQLLPNCAGSANSLPCLMIVSGPLMASANNFTPNASLIQSYSAVADRVSSSGNTRWIQIDGTQNGLQARNSTANSWAQNVANNGVNFSTANDGTWHTGNAVAQAGTNTTIFNLDGTETATTATPSNTAGEPTVVGVAALAYWAEGGWLDNFAMSGAQRTSVCGNQATFYGTTVGANC